MRTKNVNTNKQNVAIRAALPTNTPVVLALTTRPIIYQFTTFPHSRVMQCWDIIDSTHFLGPVFRRMGGLGHLSSHQFAD